MSDEQEMLNRLMQSLSSIDDDLLADVEPAKRKNVVRMPLNLIDEHPAIERSHTALHESTDDRGHMSQRGKRKRMPSRKTLISVASIAACLVVVLSILVTKNDMWKATAPKDAFPKNEMVNGPEHMADSHDHESYKGVVARNDYLLLLDSDEPVKVIESTSRPPVKPTTATDNEGASVVSREIKRLADQSAYKVLSGGEVNTVYSPLNLYQTFAFLAESVDDDRRAQLDHLYTDVFGEESDELYAYSSLYHLATDKFDAQNSVLLGAQLYERCDRALLASLCNRFFFDVYTWERETNDPLPVVFSQSVDSACWNPENELLLTFRYDADVTSARSLASVDLSEGLFHSSRGTLTNLSFYDSDDASLRHFQLDGAIACELPVEGGNLYLVLPDEGLTPDDLMAQDHFFTKLLTAEPAGENAVARFPELNFIDRHNLVGSRGVDELRKLVEAPASLRWLNGEGVSFPVIDQVIDFSLDAPVHEADSRGPDAIDRMSLEAVFDRPFIFCLTEGTYNTPVLIGVYRHPER